jgi:acyl-CoA reductase-like NAD-dependent aldehyde dehydrogenase
MITAMHNHGQLCFSTDRIIVVKGPSTDTQQFEKLLIDAFKRYHNPASGAGTRGHAQHAADVLIDAKTKGARFLLAGPEFEGPATLLPSIVIHPSEDMRIRDEETFGPSACLCK